MMLIRIRYEDFYFWWYGWVVIMDRNMDNYRLWMSLSPLFSNTQQLMVIKLKYFYFRPAFWKVLQNSCGRPSKVGRNWKYLCLLKIRCHLQKNGEKRVIFFKYQMSELMYGNNCDDLIVGLFWSFFKDEKDLLRSDIVSLNLFITFYRNLAPLMNIVSDYSVTFTEAEVPIKWIAGNVIFIEARSSSREGIQEEGNFFFVAEGENHPIFFEELLPAQFFEELFPPNFWGRFHSLRFIQHSRGSLGHGKDSLSASYVALLVSLNIT
jgi:hypothetical protein